jgi:hypothetical protein
MNEPLIYTSKGNLPIASLVYETEWLLLQREPLALKFIERHRSHRRSGQGIRPRL